MSGEGEAPSVTIGLDPQGAPNADLDLSFSTGSFGGQPASGGFGSGRASTDLMDMPEPPPVAAEEFIAQDNSGWSYQWSAAAEPRYEDSRKGDLSFPEAESTGSVDLNGAQSAPVRSTIRVPDAGTVLLGGVKRLEAAEEDDALGEPVETFTKARNDPFSQSGGGVAGGGVSRWGGASQGASNESGAVSGLRDRSSQRGEKYSIDRAESISNGVDLEDSLDAIADQTSEGLVTDGEERGQGIMGGGFGGAGLGGDGKDSLTRDFDPPDEADSDAPSGALDYNEVPPAEPTVAGNGDGPQSSDATDLYFRSSSDGTVPSLANQTPPSDESFDSRGKLRFDDQNKQQVEQQVEKAFAIPKTATPVTGGTFGKPDGQRVLEAQQSGEVFYDHFEKEIEQYRESPQRGRPEFATSNRRFSYIPPKFEGRSSEIKKNKPSSRVSVPAGLNEKTADSEAFSTFSLHVSDVSFKLARAALAQGEWPEAAKVRIEEFVNALDYGDPMPSQGERVACRLEQSIHPFLQQRNLLRVSMRTAAAGRSSSTPLRLTLLLDNSGSMERVDRQQTVRRAFALLAQQLKPIDQVTLISFSRRPRLLADKVSGAKAHELVQLIDRLPSEGGTNIEAAVQLAFEKAMEQQLAGAQNRIILLTDGAVNLGNANPDSLSQVVTTMRKAGIAFDAAGISAEGLNDEILEALTRKGDGRYYLLDSLEAADDGFARQIAGALRPAAKNVKVQIEFNPKRVGRYKLLGFEKHRLNKEDFRNDAVDAAEMAAAEAGVAVYQFEAKPDGEGDVGSVSVRFRDLSTGQMVENCWPIPYEADAPRPEQAAPSLRIATSAALLAAKLRGEPLGESVDLKTLSDLIAGLPVLERSSVRIQQLHQMIHQARQISGK